MNDMKDFKEKQINDYISNVLLNENNIDIDKIKDELGRVLGEQPGVELVYETENLIVEDGKKTVRKERLDCINVYYSFENSQGDLRFGTLKYLTD